MTLGLLYRESQHVGRRLLLDIVHQEIPVLSDIVRIVDVVLRKMLIGNRLAHKLHHCWVRVPAQVSLPVVSQASFELGIHANEIGSLRDCRQSPYQLAASSHGYDHRRGRRSACLRAEWRRSEQRGILPRPPQSAEDATVA